MELDIDIDTSHKILYKGYHPVTPFKSGDKVYIPAGVPILSMHPEDTAQGLKYDPKFGNPYNVFLKKEDG
jgi:hypothetical protein